MFRMQNILKRVAVAAIALSGTLLGVSNGPAQAATNPSWYIRLKVDDYTNNWKFDGTLLGQQVGARTDWDSQDLPAMAPFSSPYLYLTFPRPTWGAKSGDYTSDFRPAIVRLKGDWPFELRASQIGTVVYLRRDGDPTILSRSLFIDSATGLMIRGDDPRWTAKGIPLKVTKTSQKYIWRYLGP